MNSLKDIIAYLVQKFPQKNQLSNSWITKLIYLSDWKSVLTSRRQMTDIMWIYGYYGPYVRDICILVESEPELFEFKIISNPKGEKWRVVTLVNEKYTPELSENERRILDFIINLTGELNWDEIRQLVYSTYPIITSRRFSNLDLVDKAKEYKSQKS